MNIHPLKAILTNTFYICDIAAFRQCTVQINSKTLLREKCIAADI